MENAIRNKIESFVALWFFGPELEFYSAPKDDFADEIESQSKEFIHRGFDLPAFSALIGHLERVHSQITARIIPADTASKIHGLNNRQITDWDKLGVVDSDRLGARGKRTYSVVDIAWLYILRSFQNIFGAQIKVTAELLEPIKGQKFLEICSLRDVNRNHKPFVYIDSERRLKLSFTNSAIPSVENHNPIIEIPIVPIIDMVVRNSGIPNFTTFDMNGKRYFQIEGEMICLADDFQTLFKTENTQDDEYQVIRALLKHLFVKSPELPLAVFDLANTSYSDNEALKAYLASVEGSKEERNEHNRRSGSARNTKRAI